MSKLRALLILGRVSNLPTVWSNCLAGWLLAGDGNWPELGWLCVGATLVFLGGMYLNDAFDVDFDREFRRERPIPCGAVKPSTVWGLGWMWLVGGGAVLVLAARAPFGLVILLVATVLVYDAVHKFVPFAPLLMGTCRFLLYLVSATVGSFGVTGRAVWGGVVLAAYITGLSHLARRESTATPFDRVPLLLLTAPIVLAIIVNNEDYRASGLILSFVAGGWVLLSLRHTLTSSPANIGRTVGGLLAGIPLVDLLAVGWQSPELTGAFAGLIVVALLGQRFVPAT